MGCYWIYCIVRRVLRTYFSVNAQSSRIGGTEMTKDEINAYILRTLLDKPLQKLTTDLKDENAEAVLLKLIEIGLHLRHFSPR